METQVIHDIAADEIAEHIRESHCPACKAFTTMIKVRYTPDSEDGLNPDPKYVRCLKCNNLFEVQLVQT